MKKTKKLDDQAFADRQRKIISIRDKATSKIYETSRQRDSHENKTTVARKLEKAAIESLAALRYSWKDDVFENESHQYMIEGEIDLAKKTMKNAMP